jgi:hypothetical protein
MPQPTFLQGLQNNPFDSVVPFVVALGNMLSLPDKTGLFSKNFIAITVAVNIGPGVGNVSRVSNSNPPFVRQNINSVGRK